MGGNMWMFPMGYKSESLCRTAANARNCGVESEADYEAHQTCGLASKEAISSVHGFSFDVGPIPYVIYQAADPRATTPTRRAGFAGPTRSRFAGLGFSPPTSQIQL